jgi:hypothetical protein
MGHELGEVRPVLEEPFEPGIKLRDMGEQLGVEGLDGEQRDEADHGTDFERQGFAVGQIQNVVVKLILLIPEADALVADVVHRLGDLEKVLEEFGGDVLIDVVVLGVFRSSRNVLFLELS